MSGIIIVDNDYITLRYHEDKKIIYHTVHKPIPDDILREAVNAGTETMQEYGACKWLSDDRLNGPLSDEQVAWASEDWIPRTMAAGWKYWANVVPKEVIAAAALAPVMNELYEHGLRMMAFADLDEAFAWLESMEG